MQWTSYTCASDKVRDKLNAQFLKGIDEVRRQLTEPYLCKTLQRNQEGSTHDLVHHALQVHKGFEWLQVI